MEEEAYSWIRRTKFSHRFDSSRLASLPLVLQDDRIAGLKSRPATAAAAAVAEAEAAPLKQKSSPSNSKIQRNSVHTPVKRNLLTNKQRSLSPLPQTNLSDVFKEAKSDTKRFSTPHPKRKGMGRLFSKDSHSKSSNSMNTSPLRHLASMNVNDKTKSRKESPWAKYFDHAGGRVNALEAADEFSVDLSKLFLGLKFAHGAHSRLYHGIYNDEAVAVKIIRVPEDDDSGVLAARLEKQFNREVTLLSRLHHPNVIKFIAACRKPPVYCVVTEYLSEGSLRAYLHKLEEKSLPLEKLVAIALDIARGMEYIHSQGVIHRDLKPENVLVDAEFHLKIADFGIACEEVYCDSLSDDPGTYRWMAPEMIKRKSYGRKVDVYSFGLVLWEMVAGAIPYEDMNPIQAAFAVVNKEAASLPDQLDDTVNYIKQLQTNLEKMREKKDRLMGGIEKSTHCNAGFGRCAGPITGGSPLVEIHETGSALEVQMITGLEYQFMFNESIRVLHEEGADVVNAGFSVVEDTVFHTIHSKIEELAPGCAAARISERLNKKFVNDQADALGSI